MQLRDEVFRAIADPKRREILVALGRRPMAVHQLTELFDVSRPAVSKHLAVLGEAGLVSARREGKENLYEVQPEALRGVLDWVSQFWQPRLQRLKQLAERKH